MLNTDLDTLLTRVPTEVAQKLHLVHGTGNITPPTNKGIWDYLPTIDTIDTTTLWTYDNSVELLKRIQAIPEFDSILWKTGGALCPTGKSLWDYLPYLDVAVSTRSSHAPADVRQSVCLGTDPVDSIGRLLKDYLNAPVGSIPTNPTLQTVWTDAKAGYLDVAISSRAPESGGNLAAVKTDVDNLEIPIKFPSPIAQDNVSTTSPTGTTEVEITVSLPSGASRVRAMLAAFVTAKNGAATAQDIDISVSGRPSGGSWTTLISTLTDCLGLPEVDKATTGDAYMVDVTSLITGAGTWGFKVTITLSSAATVRFKTEYLLIVTYKMS